MKRRKRTSPQRKPKRSKELCLLAIYN